MGTSYCSLDESHADTFECKSWESSEGWVMSNTGWEVWTGTVEIMEVEWKIPPRSLVRALVDNGDGPPLLRENCTVMRGVDWDAGNDDGKDLYEKDKLKKEEQRRAAEEEEEEEEERKAAEEKIKGIVETNNVVGDTEPI